MRIWAYVFRAGWGWGGGGDRGGTWGRVGAKILKQKYDLFEEQEKKTSVVGAQRQIEDEPSF